MKDTNYIVYTWDQVADAFNRAIKEYNPNFFKNKTVDFNYLKEIYDDQLAKAMKDLLVQYFVLDTDRNNPDIQILINAYKQLNDMYFIGTAEKRYENR
jgi:hypothetical protein